MTTAALREPGTYTNEASSPTNAAVSTRGRIGSLDIVRGVVMLLMAIDHVRVYSGQPAGGPTPGIFFTRWVTHFVAPAFVFLAGTGAFMYGARVNDKRKLSRFLLTRGLWLVLLELTVLRVAWTFNFDFAHYMLAGVIWMIGWCMVLMAGIVFLPQIAIAAGGVAVIVGHNISNVLPAVRGLSEASPAWLWKILYFGGVVNLGENGPPLFILFVIIPWIGVMAAGYAFGRVMQMPSERRRAICLRLGVVCIAAFIVLRALDVYGDPRPWSKSPMPALLAFLNATKYPASLSFLLMTLGPMFVLLALVDKASGPFARILATFGRVPFFYYVLHIPTIHVAACIVSLVREGSVNPWLFTNHPVAPGQLPDGYRWSLVLLYVVWAIVVVALYFPCRWFAKLKAQKRSAWLSYL
ncbi:MAG TPA: heparan-alpha-glucosaminide N-acetyltransferase domain-containing protein [Gemmatimonadaceae bacterium]|nr:heparan-alpha-glucosaminide N-acetyltransferase domain-containing protein [Gemmatimonadaceae bacterium]